MGQQADLPVQEIPRLQPSSVLSLWPASLDPADRIEFSRLSGKDVLRLDSRSDDELKATAFDHPLAVERERAMWEYADRHPLDAAGIVLDAARADPDERVRRAYLWLLQKLRSDRVRDQIAEFGTDPDPEVRSWSALLLAECGGETFAFHDSRSATFDDENPFDQTLPLCIEGHARTFVEHVGWLQAKLSPLWFEEIMGRVMACTCIDTIDRDLIIEKRLKEFHFDGTDHYEIYKFAGITMRSSPFDAYHVYQGTSRHAFYPSGKVEDHSVAPIGNAVAGAQRGAATALVRDPLAGAESERAARVFGKAVQSVRGRYYGFAYVDTARVAANGMRVGAGEAQLTDPQHPIVGGFTNTFLWGTFKGKLSDLDGDGKLDVNTERCHGTKDGELDYSLAGCPNADPFDI